MRKNSFKNQLFKEITISDNKKVLVMFSGGQDSTLCLALLKNLRLDVEAIHFINKWSWDLTTQEAKRISKLLDVKLNIFDITQDFLERVVGKVKGRPCGLCKTIMDIKTIEYALKYNFKWICSGDISVDGSLKRIKNYELSRGNNNFIIGRYLDCVESGVEVPEGIRVLRPIINLTPEMVEYQLLKKYNLKVKRVHETGDKYWKYWREGCPLQYADPDVTLELDLMDKLYELNTAATNYARKKNFRASIALPSKKIVTVPQGLENELKSYLIKKGYNL